MATEVYPLASEAKWNWRCGLLRDVGESCEQWKSRLESRWDSIMHETRLEFTGDSDFSTNTKDTRCWADVIEVFEGEFTRIISIDAWEVFLYLASYLLELEYNIDDTVIWLWITEHDAIKIAQVIRIKDLPIKLESTSPFLLDSAVSKQSFQVVEFLLSTGIFSGSQVEECLETALLIAWDTLEKVTSVVCSKKSPEEAINCVKLIATLCLPQMKPALSTLDCFARFMSDELLAKEACNRAKQGRFLDYALLLMVAPERVLKFTGMPSFLDGLRSEMSSSEWPVVFRTCFLLFDIFSSVYYDFYELWQTSEGLTQKGIVHRVCSTCLRAGYIESYNDIELLDSHTLWPLPGLSDDLRPDLRENIYPKSFECQLLSTAIVP